jgi:manganese/iron transport system permease protein
LIENLLESLSYLPIRRALIACVLCGTGCSLLSVFVVLMRMPLIGVAMSHAAFAGAVFGMLLGCHPAVSGFVVCLAVAATLGFFSDRAGWRLESAGHHLFFIGAAFSAWAF